MFGDKNVSAIAAGHYPLRHVEPGACEVSMTIHIYHSAHRTAVHAHSNLQAWMRLERATDFNRALRRRFLTCVKDQRHAVAGWNFYQPPRGFRFLILSRAANDLGQFVNHRPLLVNRKLGVTDDVDKQDMRDFQLDFLFNLGRHINAPTACTRMIYNLDSTADSREQSQPREIAAHSNGSLPISIQFVYPSRSSSP